ncbi:MAG: TetR/AcrR family transcriptional regulator [Candidatus Marinimicrobia bacterium]|nr:TetR/AcrR family transcriptional regulator [Candidatus Neomarinimicrobiota bacterium]MCF7839688.1 TetR/AcrR family transcriptional regulator [Candidatus Neomarinimicrobiota bacterium]MCF7901816.1 TetR/AcrR family transcriptional regulator [Candidatus Neomarinimicrobiota bacterium]
MTEKKSREIRQKEILEAALETFVKKGYNATRMDDLVKATGLSKGAIYWHFSSKHELFMALIEHWMDQFAPLLSPGYHAGKSASKILRDIGRFTLKTFYLNKNWYLAELEFWAMANRDKEIRTLARKLYKRIIGEFESVIRYGVKEGEFHTDNPTVMAMSIMTTLQGMIWFVMIQPDGFAVDDYVSTSLDAIIAALTKKPADMGANPVEA